MALSFYDMQKQVDDRVTATPDGYWWSDKMIRKLQEEIKETKDAWNEYIEARTSSDKVNIEVKLKNLKTEIGDVIFAVCCLANTRWINLERSYMEFMEISNKSKDITEIESSLPKNDIDFWEVLASIAGLAAIHSIQLEECFNLMMEKNEKRAKNDYKKEQK